MDGNATLTTTASRVIMKKPGTAAASVKPELEVSRMPWLTRRRPATVNVDIISSFPGDAFPRPPGAGKRRVTAAQIQATTHQRREGDPAVRGTARASLPGTSLPNLANVASMKD